jgi:6-phosphogluconolactonase
MLGARVLRPTTLGLLGLLLAGSLGCGKADESSGREFLYVGGEQNLTWYTLGADDGSLARKGSIPYDLTVAYVAVNADGTRLHALLRTNPPDENGVIAAKQVLEGYVITYSINPSTGALKEISRVSSAGGRPTYITFDRTGRFVLVANNYGHLPGQGHSIAVFKVQDDGTLAEAHQTLMAGFTPPPAGMTAPVPFVRSHQIRVHPSNKYVYVPNIDSDTVSQFLFDADAGMLTPNDPPAFKLTGGEDNQPQGGPTGIFFGPRHLDFHPNGKWIYLSNEYTALVVAFEVQDDGTLTQIDAPVRGVPASFDGVKWQSEIRVHPSGRYVYVGERDKRALVMDANVDAMGARQDSMAIFAVNAKTGALTLKGNVATDKTPRNFALDPSARWLVVGNQDGDSLMTFRVGDGDGMLQKAFGPMKGQHAPYVHVFVSLP